VTPSGNELRGRKDIKKERLGKIGYLVRMDHGRVFKKIFERESKGRMRVERPRLRKLKMFKIVYGVDRGEWTSVLRRSNLSESLTAKE